MFAGSPLGGGEDKRQFLLNARAARDERDKERRREDAATRITSSVRGFLVRQAEQQRARAELDAFLSSDERATAAMLYYNTRKLMYFYAWREKKSRSEEGLRDDERLQKVCARILASMEGLSGDQSYVEAMSDPKISVQWIALTKRLLSTVSENLKRLQPTVNTHLNAIILYLHVLVTMTNVSSWKLRAELEGLRGALLRQLAAKLTAHIVERGLLANLQHLLLAAVVRQRPLLGRAPLTAVTWLALRPLHEEGSAATHEDATGLFVLHFLSVPTIVYQLRTLAPDAVSLLLQPVPWFSGSGLKSDAGIANSKQTNITGGCPQPHGSKEVPLLQRVLSLLVDEQRLRIVFNSLEASFALSLLANLVDLAHIVAVRNQRAPAFIDDPPLDEAITEQLIAVASRILECCQQYVGKRQSAFSHYHPILGWFSQKIDAGHQEVIPHIKSQLQLLWGNTLSQILFRTLFAMKFTSVEEPVVPETPSLNYHSTKAHLTEVMNIIRGGSFGRCGGSVAAAKMFSPDVTSVALTCKLYETAIASLSELRLDILTGLSFQSSDLLPRLWMLINALSGAPAGKARVFLELLQQQNIKASSFEFQILRLFCNCASHLIVVLDDSEMYEKQQPFSLAELVSISGFLNVFLYKIVVNQLLDLKSLPTCPLFTASHSLLMLLYRRDSRRNFTPRDHWLVKTKFATLLNDLEAGKLWAQMILHKLPHVLPHRDRVQLFRRCVQRERMCILTGAADSTHITVQRARIVEDGFQQLNALSPHELKSTIRVRFVNVQGLDEAGIDQDGVFKEFLEETMRRVFDPALNLFSTTNDQRLYPSATSYVNENHLALFEFVGKMLAKAVYEGIVVDVPFAMFFLSQILGHHQSIQYYSYIDELGSLDEQLYSSLTYVKNYRGDVEDLALFFCIDDDSLGKIVTHELIPAGRTTPVTNNNKIRYIHLTAQYKMQTQIAEQTKAFIRGFRSLIRPEWVAMFSAPELQRLFSGDDNGIDLQDLRANTKYFGGFHNNHRVIGWLWDILRSDFTTEERRLFLKFVTSCSKPPLLGFANLEPPFSIRCVELSDDQDTGM